MQAAPGVFRSDSWGPQGRSALPTSGERLLQIPNKGKDPNTTSAQGRTTLELAHSVPIPHPPHPAQHRAVLGSSNSLDSATLAAGFVKQGSLGPGPTQRVARLQTAGSARHMLFDDALAQLSAKEIASAEQALYKLPSMTFMEALLEEMDKRTISAGRAPAEPPLYLPVEEFDIPHTAQRQPALALPGAPAAAAAAQRPPSAAPPSSPAVCRVLASSLSCEAVAPPPAFAGFGTMAHAISSEPPSPQLGGRVAAVATARRPPAAALPELYEPGDRPNASLPAGKAGRVVLATAKSKHLAGAKRKLPAAEAPARLAAAGSGEARARDAHSQGRAASDGDVTISADEEDSGDEVTKRPSRPGNGKRLGRTICLNCGSHQTPQWRCGPLGPRTLCNACGVRYKKNLPLNCWPIRDGMVLPPGAVLPATVVIPEGMTIVTQPLTAAAPSHPECS